MYELTARHRREAAWARDAMCESAFTVLLVTTKYKLIWQGS